MSGTTLIRLKLSATICNEYATRCVFTGEGEWPEVAWDAPNAFVKGVVVAVPPETAKAILEDAAYNSDPRAVDVGPYGTPLSVFNAYRALAGQARKALGKGGN